MQHYDNISIRKKKHKLEILHTNVKITLQTYAIYDNNITLHFLKDIILHNSDVLYHNVKKKQ